MSSESHMGKVGRTLAAFGLLLVSACAAPTQISSNKAQDYTAQPTRLFVVTDVGSDFGNEFANSFHAKLINIASECGSAAEVSRISALELDDSTRRREIDGFKPDVFLSIRRNGGTKMSSGQLVDIQSKRIVWRAAVTFYRGGTIIPSTDRGAALAVDITNKMKEDHIFRTCEV